MFATLAYLSLCRSIQLLVPLARGDAAKDLELLVLRQAAQVSRHLSDGPGFGAHLGHGLADHSGHERTATDSRTSGLTSANLGEQDLQRGRS
jgi:hypothetical protein